MSLATLLGAPKAPADHANADTPAHTPKPPRERAPRRRGAEHLYFAEVLTQLQQLASTMTEIAARFAGRQPVNNVLRVATITFPANGVYVIDHHVAIGALVVNNVSTHTVTVHAGPGSDAPPSNGTGMYLVAAATERTVNVAAHQITLYGTAGDTISFQALTTGAIPVAS